VTYNWISIIVVLLLLGPLLLGWMRGLSGEFESLKYRIHAAFHTLRWIASFALAFWGLRQLMQWQLQQSWQVPQLQWMMQQLHSSLWAWAVAVLFATCLAYWVLEIFFYPVEALLLALIQQMQRWAGLLPGGIGRLLAAFLQAPKGLLRALVFAVVLHFALPVVHVPALTEMARESALYQWAESQVITPLFTGVWSKQLPLLQEQAGHWMDQLSREAAQNGPDAARGFFTWQTRFDSNAQINATAREVVQGAKTDREKAYRLYRWIGSHVQYDDHKAEMIASGNFQTLSFGAIPTFESRRGVCTDYSSLMVAMGRAVGLQVKQEFGTALLPDGSSGPHAWNLVYLADEGKWIPCDPTWEQAGNFFDNPDFYETHKPDGKEI
jgi:hypothetical protein